MLVPTADSPVRAPAATEMRSVPLYTVPVRVSVGVNVWSLEETGRATYVPSVTVFRARTVRTRADCMEYGWHAMIAVIADSWR